MSHNGSKSLAFRRYLEVVVMSRGNSGMEYCCVSSHNRFDLKHLLVWVTNYRKSLFYSEQRQCYGRGHHVIHSSSGLRQTARWRNQLSSFRGAGGLLVRRPLDLQSYRLQAGSSLLNHRVFITDRASEYRVFIWPGNRYLYCRSRQRIQTVP